MSMDQIKEEAARMGRLLELALGVLGSVVASVATISWYMSGSIADLKNTGATNSNKIEVHDRILLDYGSRIANQERASAVTQAQYSEIVRRLDKIDLKLDR